MTDLASHRAQSTLWLVAASMLAISFHILATININGVYLRVGSSDFLIPVLIAMMVWAWVRNSGAKFLLAICACRRNSNFSIQLRLNK